MYFVYECYEKGRGGREEGDISLQVQASALTLQIWKQWKQMKS
jgi:hypothetical protein